VAGAGCVVESGGGAEWLEQVKRIRKLKAEGKTYKELAQLFKISRDTVFKIVHRKTWSHIE
jgi:DNA invertase Pin-like site-specific DNA recombinase